MPARYAEVIVDITHADVDRVFTYGIPAGMDIVPGTRVSIPFGRQTTEGFVIGVKDEPGIDPDKIKDINAPLEEYPAILPQLIDLAQDMSAQTHCPLAATLRLMVPAQMRGGRIRVKTEKAAQLLVAGDALEDARKAQSRAPKRRLLLDLLSDGEVYPVSELAVLVRQPLEGLRALEQQGFVRVIDQEVLRSPYPDDAVLFIEDYEDGTCEILIKAEDKQHARFVKIVDDAGSPVARLFLKPAGECSIAVRPGKYRLSHAAGTIWYGEDLAFGPQGLYARVEQDLILDAPALRMTISLASREKTNVQTETIGWRDF